MRSTKILIFLALGLVIALWGCAGQKKVEASKQEQITENLVPSKAEAKGQGFLVELNNLEVDATVETASKEMVETPTLKGSIKITNESSDILDIQGVTLQYLDGAGKPIGFKSGEPFSKANSYFQPIKPGKNFEGSIDAKIPRGAVNGKTLGKLEINVVYISTPLRHETLTLPEKVG